MEQGRAGLRVGREGTRVLSFVEAGEARVRRHDMRRHRCRWFFCSVACLPPRLLLPVGTRQATTLLGKGGSVLVLGWGQGKQLLSGKGESVVLGCLFCDCGRIKHGSQLNYAGGSAVLHNPTSSSSSQNLLN